GDEHRLGVPGEARAHLLVRRVGGEAAHVPGRGGDDAVEPPEDALGTPAAAHRAVAPPGALGPGAPPRRARHPVPPRHGEGRGGAPGQGLLGRDHAGCGAEEHRADLLESGAPTAAGGRQPALLMTTPHEPEYSLRAARGRARAAAGGHPLSRLGLDPPTSPHAGTMTDKPAGWLSRITANRRDTGPAPVAGAHTPRRAAGGPAGHSVAYAVRAAAARPLRLLVPAAAAALLGYPILTFKPVVVALVVAILLAVLLEPVSTWLRKRLRFPRTLASAATLVGALLFVVGLHTAAGRSVIVGFADLADQAVQGFNELVSWLSDGPLGIDEQQLQTWLDEGLAQLESNSDALISGALAAT